MKAQLPLTPPATLLNLRVVSSGADRGGQGTAVKAAETARPTAEPRATPAMERFGGGNQSNTQLQFSVDEPSGRMVVSIVDRDTSEVVRQIPAEEMLAIARQIEQQLRETGNTQGLFIADEA